jgi:hypothetical protein
VSAAQWEDVRRGIAATEASLTLEEVWNDFIDALRENAKRDGLLAADSALASHLEQLKDWPAKLSSGADVTIAPDSATARDLMSLLPILPHWDLWGAIRQAWDPAPAPTVIRESLWQDLGRMAEPFYCNHFLYLINGEHDQELRSRQLLGYSVAAEAFYDDLSNRGSDPHRISLREYFDYAYLPHGRERAHYTFYAFLMDAIQLALSANEELVPSVARDTQRHLYYFAYPVFSQLGRRHFFQIYVRPSQGSSDIEGLWNAWHQLHEQLGWDRLRSVLVDELEQVDLARFQTRMNDDMTKKARLDSTLSTDRVVEPIIAEQLHLLLPVHCACNGTDKWTYQTRANALLGHHWDKTSAEDHTTLACCGDNEQFHRAKDSPCNGLGNASAWRDNLLFAETPVHREINLGRRQRLITQQMEFARTIWESKSELRRLAKSANDGLWKTRKPLLVKHKLALLRILQPSGSTYGERFRREGIRELLGCGAAEFFSPFFYGATPGEAEWCRAYLEITQSSLHLLVSDYIETGVVRWLTHHAPKGTPDKFPLTKVADDHKYTWDPLRLALEGQTCLAPLREAVKVIAEPLESFLRSWTGPDISANSAPENIKAAREKLRGKISTEDRLRSYLKLGACDSVYLSGSPALNLPSPAFGVECSDKPADSLTWPNAIMSLRKAKWNPRLSLIAAIVPIEQSYSRDSEFHVGLAIRLMRNYVLVGNEIEGVGAEVSGSGSGVPERFEMIGEVLGALGETFWLPNVRPMDGSTRGLLRLSDRIDVQMEELYGIGQVVSYLGKKLKRSSAYDFIICAFDRFKID